MFTTHDDGFPPSSRKENGQLALRRQENFKVTPQTWRNSTKFRIEMGLFLHITRIKKSRSHLKRRSCSANRMQYDVPNNITFRKSKQRCSLSLWGQKKKPWLIIFPKKKWFVPVATDCFDFERLKLLTPQNLRCAAAGIKLPQLATDPEGPPDRPWRIWIWRVLCWY